ncbi:hypothetical protein J2X42_001834 [Arthrobacter sp. BE255]|nr:hypothetical protein [Arthrobacter sp. BE255]
MHEGDRATMLVSFDLVSAFAAVVSHADSCGFCIGTHRAIAGLAPGLDSLDVDESWRDGKLGPVRWQRQSSPTPSVLATLYRCGADFA